MLSLGLIQRRLRLVYGLLPTFALILPSGLFPRPFKFAALLFPFEGESGLSLCRLVDGAGGNFLCLAAFRLSGGFVDPVLPRSVGSSACSAKDPLEPMARLRMTPGFAMVAAMTSGSWLSFAAP